MPDFILAGISGAISPRETGRLSGCTGPRTRTAAHGKTTVLFASSETSRGFTCPRSVFLPP